MISITKKQKIFLWMLTPVFILLSLGSLETSPVLSGFWFLSFVVAVFLALSSSSKNSSDKNSETAKPNILILLPVYLLLEGKDPFADLTKDKGDAKLNAIGTYAVLYKIYCYNKLLAQKFGKDIYLSTIIEKQREKIAAADLAISEHFVAQGLDLEEAIWQFTLPQRVRKYSQEQYGPKAEARFLDRKADLDAVVYSLLRVKDPGLASELFLRIAGAIQIAPCIC
ncbi:hypothetical protein EBS02_09715 [bacterium]|nr:hypothetical protein [bacterium]